MVAGDQVGLSGLQKRYDAQMRGTPGVRVRLVAAKPTDSSASPSPTPSPTAEAEPVVLFEVKPVPGKPLTTTLNVGLQKLAEKTLAGDQAGQCAGRHPSFDRGDRGGRERPRQPGPVARHGRSGGAGIDVQGRLRAGPARGLA